MTMELREDSAGAQQQLAGDRTHESRMDEYLRSLGLYRKKIAKDGSCLFRAVAEQVLHCQGLHTKVRAACVNHLKKNRSTYELFIEGDFEKYLENLRDPQSWVGQVEITVLAELYKHDFIIFQEPDQPPVHITENGFNDKVRLCFLNGNHYDSVYPQSFEKSAAVCQSILYELLYDRVCGVDRSVLGSSVKGGRGRDKLDSEECKSSEESDLEEDEFWSSESREKTSNGTNVRLPPRGRGRGRSRGRGRDLLSTKAQKSLNPGLYRNVEYDVWLRSKRIQQQRDFCMAAGMQYSIGDKCKVQLSGSSRFFNAYVQDVSPDNGPVTVFIEELKRAQTVPLLSLRLPSEEPQSWQTVSEKSKRHGAPNSGVQASSEWESRGSRAPNKVPPQPASSARVQKQHSWPPQNGPDEPAGASKHRWSDQRGSPVSVPPGEVEENVVLELLHKDERNFPALGTSPQTPSVGEVMKKGVEKRGSRKKECVSETDASQKSVQRQKSGTEENPRNTRGSEELGKRPSPTGKEKPMHFSSYPPPAILSGPKNVPYSSQTSFATVPGLDKSVSEAIKKTPVQPKNSPDGSPFATSQPISVPTSAAIQSASAPKPLETAQVPTAYERNSQPNQAPSQITFFGSQIPPFQVPVAVPTQTTLGSCGSIPDAPVKSTQSAFISTPPLLTASAIPVSGQTPVRTPILDSPERPSLPIDGSRGAATAQKTVDPHNTMTPVPLPQAPPPSVSTSSSPAQAPPSSSSPARAPPPTISSSSSPAQAPPPFISSSSSPAQAPPPFISSSSSPAQAPPPFISSSSSPAQAPPPSISSSSSPAQAPPPSISSSSSTAHAPPPDSPQSSCNASDPQPRGTTPASGVAPAPDHPSQPQQIPYPPLQWSQLLQDPVYPGFPLNEKGELEPPPSFSLFQKGEDLPQDINVLRFFFNLGVKAYTQPMFPPIIYLGPLNQAYQMNLRGPPPSSSDSPANSTLTSWQPENPSPPHSLSSIPDASLESHAPIAPVAVGSGGYNDHPSSVPMQVPPRPPMHWSASSGPSAYPGTYPTVQFSAPPLGNHMYSPSSLGYHHIPTPPMHHEALNHGRTDAMQFIPPILDRDQENGQRSLNPQYGSLQKIPSFPGGQPQLNIGDFKPVDIPVSMAEMQHQPYGGACPVVQPFQLGQLQDVAGLASQANGNVFAKSLHAGQFTEDRSHLIHHVYSPDDKWSVQENEVDLRVGHSFFSQSYRGGGRRGQDDRGGYRGRSLRARKVYSNRGRPDDGRHYGRRGAGPALGIQQQYQ